MARNSFASAFSNAFLQQSQLAIQNQRQAEKDERQRLLWEREDQRYNDEQAKQAQVDEQLTNLRKLNESGRVGAGLHMPSASFEAPQQAAEGFTAPAQLGRGLTVGDAATGFDAPVLQAQGRKARESDYEAILGNVAAIKGDVAGLRASRQATKTAKYDEMVADKIDWWRNLPPEEKVKVIAEHSQRSDIQGYGVYKPGTGKMSGYMTYMGPDGTPIKLNEREVESLISLGAAAEVDPVRSRADLEKVSDKVRAIALQQFQAQTQGVQVNNTAARYANQDELGRAGLAISQREAGQREAALARGQIEIVGLDGNGNMVAIDKRSTNPRQILIPAPEGFKPSAKTFGTNPIERDRLNKINEFVLNLPTPKDHQERAKQDELIIERARRLGVPPEALGYPPIGGDWGEPAAQPAPKPAKPAAPSAPTIERPASLREVSTAVARQAEAARRQEGMRTQLGRGRGLTEDDLDNLQYLR